MELYSNFIINESDIVLTMLTLSRYQEPYKELLNENRILTITNLVLNF